MKNLKLLIFTTVIILMFSACSAVVALTSVADRPEKGWANKSALSELMSNQSKVLLTKDEKQKVANSICLQSSKKDKVFTSLDGRGGGEIFCSLKNEDKIYFIEEYENVYGIITTEYLLVIKNEPYDIIEIKRKWSDKLGQSVPIVDRLH